MRQLFTRDQMTQKLTVIGHRTVLYKSSIEEFQIWKIVAKIYCG